MRLCKIYRLTGESQNNDLVREFAANAIFHKFTIDFEELRDGVGIYPVAIVEYNDGSVGSVPVGNIMFADTIGLHKELVAMNEATAALDPTHCGADKTRRAT